MASPKIVFENIEQCRDFMRHFRDRIVAGDYDLKISSHWVPDLSEPEIQLLARHCSSSRRAIAESTGNASIFEDLARDQSWAVRESVATNGSTPVYLLQRLAHDSNTKVQTAAARNRSTPSNELVRLGRSAEADIREAVASNSSTPGDVLIPLSYNETERVRWKVGSNPSSGSDILARLAREYSPKTREHVAANEGASEDLLAKLCQDSDVGVRAAVAGNKSASEGILLNLTTDKWELVQLKIVENPASSRRVLSKIRRTGVPEARLAAKVRLAGGEQSYRCRVLRSALSWSVAGFIRTWGFPAVLAVLLEIPEGTYISGEAAASLSCLILLIPFAGIVAVTTAWTKWEYGKKRPRERCEGGELIWVVVFYWAVSLQMFFGSPQLAVGSWEPVGGRCSAGWSPAVGDLGGGGVVALRG